MSSGTPLGQVLGHGSAKSGTGHWWAQRLSAVALLPLGLWFIFALASRGDLSRAAWLAFIALPWHAVALALFLLALLYHSYLGVQVVVEDYVHDRPLKVATLIMSGFVHATAAAAGLFAILRIAFRAAT